MTSANLKSGAISASLIVLLVGLFLIALAVPRVIAYGTILQGGDVADFWHRPVSDEALGEQLEEDRRAVRWLPADANLQMIYARDLLNTENWARQENEAGSQSFGPVSLALRAGIAGAPNRAKLWCMLAPVRAAENAKTEEIAPIIRLSYLIGPRSGPCALNRMPVVVSNWDEMPDDLRQRAGDEIASLWKASTYRAGLIDQYLAMDFKARSIVRRYAFDNARSRKEFDALLLSRLKRARSPDEVPSAAN